jgi:hypothetical protein
VKLLAVLLVVAAPAAAQQAATPDEQAAIARASSRGSLIFAYDRAAWYGTDDMLAKLPDARTRVGGWVVEGGADAPVLTFFDRNGARAVYQLRVQRGAAVDGRAVDVALTPAQARLAAAVVTARAALAADRSVLRCADKPFNTVVLPPETEGGPVAVYFLTPQLSREAIPFGGHYRIEVDGAGRAGPVRAFSRSCIAIPTGPPAGANGARPEGAMVSHLLDPTPTEIHVFSSLAMRQPVFVATTTPERRLWIVQGPRITGPRPIPTR